MRPSVSLSVSQVAIIIDDIIDTAGTIVTAADILVRNGATRVLAIISHGQLSGNAVELLEQSPVEAVVVSNTIPQEDNLGSLRKLRTYSVAATFAEAIRRIHNGESVSFLFEHVPLD
jgi:ribose-phosphate pyrophosphokinase